ncbi:hypothetical protein AB0442_42485 [Kitasatospora sp. NPDC085895]|uniref:hypothetical protein n=1 Tax=Kitasatospora sp. NPDC085895 TaxID=3155057 RepID=UPI00344BC206
MKSSHSSAALTAAFDEPNLIADAGLVRLAERVGIPGLAGKRLRIAVPATAAAPTRLRKG